MRQICVGAHAWLLALSLIAATTAFGDDENGKLKPEDLEKWGTSKLVFTGRLTNVTAGPVGRSMPPVYTHQLSFEIDEVLRGGDADSEIKPGAVLTCSNVARQRAEPTFPEGKKCLVAADFSRQSWKIVRVEEQTDKNVASAKLALKVPFGWSVKEGKLVSPWATLGKSAWPEGQGMNVELLCSATGRPAFMTGAATLSVKPVPPKKEIKWTNPDGDGLYTITVSNPTDQPIKVPALLVSEKGDTLWNESLVILCQGKTYSIPSAKGVQGNIKPTLLKPGEKVSTVVNALTLDGPNWPRGGQRVEFQFCLGEKSTIQSFYYLSRHHDKIRKESASTEKEQSKNQTNGSSDGANK